MSKILDASVEMQGNNKKGIYIMKLSLWAISAFLVAVAGSGMAAPKKSEADSWVREFVDLKQKSTDALHLRDASGPPRAAMRLRLTQLDEKAKKIFGNDDVFSVCISATRQLGTLYDTTFDARSGSYIAISGIARQGLEVGQVWGECRNAVDQIH